jgi:hypothetical protein
VKSRTLPIKWFDLVTFDPNWIKGKTIVYFEDTDGINKPMVFDAEGRRVY